MLQHGARDDGVEAQAGIPEEGFGRLAGVDEEVGPAEWDELPADLRAQAADAVERIRPRLAARFRDLPAADLAVSGCVLTAAKT